MKDQFERIRNAYAITLGDSLMPGAGVYGMGAVAAVMPDEASMRAFVEEHAEPLADLGRGPAGFTQVGDPWQFMRRAAEEGLAGIEGAVRAVYPDRFMFMVRVEEAGLLLPTVLASITETGWDECLTRTGVKPLDHAELLHWQRHDILDAVTGQWGQRCPFRDWDHGAPLYELCTDDIVVLLAHVPLLGDWNSTEGAFAFFTSEEEAQHYHQHHLGNGRNQMVLVGPGAPDDPHEAMASLRPRVVADVKARLQELVEVRPFAAWCVNPDGHRENSAYGRTPLGDVYVSDDGQGADPGSHSMVAVSGVWTLMPGNVFELASSMPAWNGRDTIRWSGGQSLQLLQLDRSFASEPPPQGLDLRGLTEAEAEEVASDALGGVDLEQSWSELTGGGARIGTTALDHFHVVCWDSVTGDGAEYPWVFPGFLAALKHLVAYEREHDRVHRVEGAVSCMHIGFSGSGDAEFEDLRSQRFQTGLRRIAVRVLRRGYRPSDAEHLVALCNWTLRTLHVDFAGFSKDLLWASTTEQQESLLGQLEIDPSAWASWASSADASVDPEGRKLVLARLGESAWERLLPKSRHFLATALVHLSEQGHAPQLDYAPISLGVVKCLEVELVRLMESFRDGVGARDLGHDEDDHAQRSLAAFMAGKTPPTLGTISYLLRKPKGHTSGLIEALHAFLSELPNAEFLTSPKFAKRTLQKVINKYRNGGVHDSPIPELVCRECVDVLIGDPANPGCISQVTAWQS